MAYTARSYPFIAAALKRVLGAAPAPEAEVLQPEETEGVTPPAMLPGQADRIIGTDEHSVLSFHLTAMSQDRVVHAPVLRWHYRNALVTREGFATPRHKQSFARPSAAVLHAPIRHVATVRFCHSSVARRYFGHWLMDSVPSTLIDPTDGEAWFPASKDWLHAPHYVTELRLATLDSELVHADTLIAYQDYSQGSHKRARYAALRARMAGRNDCATGPDCVYIVRGSKGAARLVANEDALSEDLARRGWAILDVSTASVSEICKTLSNAKVVVGIEGSHLVHLYLLLKAGTTMIVLMPQDRFGTNQLGRARAIGLSVGFVVMLKNPQGHYVADVSEILATVDLAAPRASVS